MVDVNKVKDLSGPGVKSGDLLEQPGSNVSKSVELRLRKGQRLEQSSVEYGGLRKIPEFR